MPDAPQLDGRRARAIRRDVADLAPYYVDGWDPDAGGVGAGLVDVFAELGAEVTERLDAAPAMHRVAFFEAMGFAARPAQAARVPVQYTLAPEAPRNVAVRAGTAAIAAADEEVAFHVGNADAFEATPARLTDVLSVDPAADAIYDHGDAIDGGDATPWRGENRQAHEWFVGDADHLAAGEGDTIEVDVDTDVDPAVLESDVEWHYYGEADEDGPEGWQHLRPSDGVETRGRAGGVTVSISPGGPLVEHEVDGVESRWLRCRTVPGVPLARNQTFEVRGVGMRTSSTGEQLPDSLLANDVPQQNPAGDEPIRPFGDQPQPGDTFYLASEPAFSKAGAVATLEFTGHGSDGEAAAVADGGSVTVAAAGTDSVGVNELSAERDQTESAESSSEGAYATSYERESLVAAEAANATGAARIHPEARGQLSAGAGGEDPTLSWEYWDGSGWSGLGLDEDTTGAFTAGGTSRVEFTVPDDLEPTTVSGHEGHWIRVRLVGGGYGRRAVAQRTGDTQWVRTLGGSPPEYDEITVSYEVTDRHLPGHVRTHNALAATERGPEATYRPFVPLPESEQTLYLGFDGPLSGGPLQLFAGVDEHPYPDDFAPKLRWERRRPNDPGWTRLDVRDETAGLTEQGFLGVIPGKPTRATVRFGRERHWVRARATGDEFEVGGDPAVDDRRGRLDRREVSVRGRAGREVSSQLPRTERVADGGRTDLVPCGATVETAPPGGDPTKAPPTLTGLYVNTGWARNVRAVEGELLGGSDGERGQTFPLATPPAVDVEVWVDELAALSTPQREALEAERPDDVDVERTSDGDVRAFWVRWLEVPDLLDSAADARHFAVDATDGEVRFGDGTRGRIPPRGANNVRASYRTGGGAAGNVPVGAVAELKSGLPFVEEVTNPAPGAGGADTEATAEVLERAPQAVKDRGRAVTPADYERLAADASRRVARARCLPAVNAGGDYDPGYVTVLVVPRATTETPVPSIGLLDRVEASLEDRAPASVVAGERLIVRGPSFVEVAVGADVVAGDVGSLHALEERLWDAVAAFLHPLTGRGGEGWDFGGLPTRSDVFALLEGVEGVDHVSSLALTFTGRESVTIGEGAPQPDASPDALVRGGEHDLTVSPGGRD